MNRLNPIYCCVNGEIVEAIGAHNAHSDVPCIDTRFDLDEPKERVGKFTRNEWEHIPVEKPPKEFRLQLLIMGIQL